MQQMEISADKQRTGTAWSYLSFVYLHLPSNLDQQEDQLDISGNDRIKCSYMGIVLRGQRGRKA